MKINKRKLAPVAIAAGVFLVVVLVRKIANAWGSGGIFADGGAEVAEAARARIEQLAVSQARMSKSMDAIMSIADGLYAAMDDIGTDEAAIFRFLEGLNTEDLKAVYKAFGVRAETIFWMFDIKKGDLFVWFRDELSAGDYARVVEIFSKTGLV